MKPKSLKGQLELSSFREREHDRNYHLGGRSFYFFDFDDNILYLSTQIMLFHKRTAEEVALSSSEWTMNHHTIGVHGAYRDFEIRLDDNFGSYRNFRDHGDEMLRRLGRKEQPFVEDVRAALAQPDALWMGPSWQCFYHACFNQRPVALITARGHHPDTIKEGIRVLVEHGVLPMEPNYLAVFPVSHPEVRNALGDEGGTMSVAELKQNAIRASVARAIEEYGMNPHHRFGMSDDDPKNIQLIHREMVRLKSELPEMSFFIIETQNGDFSKTEVFAQGSGDDKGADQLSLFNND